MAKLSRTVGEEPAELHKRTMLHRLAQLGVPVTLDVYQPKSVVLRFHHVSESPGRLVITPSAGLQHPQFLKQVALADGSQ